LYRAQGSLSKPFAGGRRFHFEYLGRAQAGRPVLIGARSVAASKAVSKRLTAAGLSLHTVLNARQDRTEAEIVAQAGQPSRITRLPPT